MHIKFFGAAGEVTGSRHCVTGQANGKPFQLMID